MMADKIPNDQMKVLIMGGGPAGLAAGKILTDSSAKCVVFEKDDGVGGLSRTHSHNGFLFDLGGHRFFTKKNELDEFIKRLMVDELINVQRSSKIYFINKYFEYPPTIMNAFMGLGPAISTEVFFSFLREKLRIHKKPAVTLEDWVVSQFGRKMFELFFKNYTEKVWGVPCSRISAEWGAQRIKGLSVWSTLIHALRKVVKSDGHDIGQKGTETSLIEQFLYPKFGPGQMWDEVARRIKEKGGEIYTGCRATRLITDGWNVKAVETSNSTGDRGETFEGDYFFSTAPVQEIMRSFDVAPPKNVLEVSDGLVYRDFITVGLLLRSLRISDENATGRELIRDNWIYIQEPDVLLGRLQIFNNWSPFMVADPANVWLGLEYFCDESDELWNLSDDRMVKLATEELIKIGIIDGAEVLDSTVLRMEKTYPAYFGTYERFAEIREHVDKYGNVFLIGRNGMHRYNNQDHSMLTAMMAVDDIIAGKTGKAGLWEVNTETDYHEEKGSSQ